MEEASPEPASAEPSSRELRQAPPDGLEHEDHDDGNATSGTAPVPTSAGGHRHEAGAAPYCPSTLPQAPEAEVAGIAAAQALQHVAPQGDKAPSAPAEGDAMLAAAAKGAQPALDLARPELQESGDSAAAPSSPPVRDTEQGESILDGQQVAFADAEEALNELLERDQQDKLQAEQRLHASAAAPDNRDGVMPDAPGIERAPGSTAALQPVSKEQADMER